MKKIFLSLLIILSLFVFSGCTKKTTMIDGKKINLDKEYKDKYVTYKYPSIFKEKTFDNSNYPYPLNNKLEYEYYDSDKLFFTLRIEENDAGIAFSPMNQDAENLEKDSSNKNLKRETLKSNGKNLVKYTFNKDDEYGKNTLYHVYYAGYSYAGINEFIKIYFINATDIEDFENRNKNA